MSRDTESQAQAARSRRRRRDLREPGKSGPRDRAAPLKRSLARCGAAACVPFVLLHKFWRRRACVHRAARLRHAATAALRRRACCRRAPIAAAPTMPPHGPCVSGSSIVVIVLPAPLLRQRLGRQVSLARFDASSPSEPAGIVDAHSRRM